MDVVANVFVPGGGLLYRVDGLTGKSGLERVPVLAKAAGRYRIELTCGGGQSYRLFVPPKSKAGIRDRRDVEGAAAYYRGRELQKAGDYEKAEKEFQQALSAWEESGNPAGQSDAAYQLQKIFSGRDAWGEALPFQVKAWKLYHVLGNRKQEAVVLNDLGLAYKAKGNLESGLSLVNKAIRIAGALHESKIEMKAMLNRGMIYSKQGEYDKALKDLEAVLKWSQERKDAQGVVETLNALGNVYLQLEDPDTALSLHKQALVALRDNPEPAAAARTFTHLGDAYRKKGDYDRAARHYLRSLSFLQNVRRPHDEATALNNLALIYYAMGRRNEALNTFRHCLRTFGQQGDSASAAVALTNIGWVLATMRRYREAAEAYAQALEVLHQNENRVTEAATYFGLAWAEWQRGNLISARGSLEAAIGLVETLRTKADRSELRSLYLAGRQDMYESLVAILMEQHRRDPARGYDLKAFEVSEQARSRSLLDELEGRPVLPKLSVREIQRQILSTDDIVLLEYSLGQKRSFLWVVTATTFSSYGLPPGEQIEKLARDVYALLKESNKIELRSAAISKSIELSRVLLGPVAGRLGAKKLLIVAPPILQYIPLGVLPEDTRDSRHPGRTWPKPLMLRHQIVSEPSATVLATLCRRREKRPPPAKRIAVLAGPAFSPPDVKGSASSADSKSAFPRLKFSRWEAEAVKRQAKDASLFLGPSASRQMVLDGRLKGYPYLHFSTHGLLDRVEPENSAIVLSLFDSKGRRVDGFLRAGEIAKLDLPAELAVLSACQTGLGQEIRGEGLVGLTQAFFSAGSSRVMVSLWNVDQQPTAYLMERFYKNLLSDDLSPAAALNEAQVWMWQQPKWSAPSYWAGFILQGKWQ